ncbi:hypothetical protein D3C85_1235680 [compost metagenome]
MMTRNGHNRDVNRLGLNIAVIQNNEQSNHSRSCLSSLFWQCYRSVSGALTRTEVGFSAFGAAMAREL